MDALIWAVFIESFQIWLTNAKILTEKLWFQKHLLKLPANISLIIPILHTQRLAQITDNNVKHILFML